MKRHPFRAAEDVTRRSIMHHAPPLDERRPRHRAFDARPSDRNPAIGIFNAVVASLVLVLAVALLLHVLGRIAG